MANFSGLPIGVPLDTETRSTTEVVPVGTRIYDADGNEFTFVKAGAAISALQAVRFAGSSAGYDDVRATSAADQFVLGVATAAFASGDYGFVQTRGVVTVLATDSITVGAPVASSSTAGLLAAATTSSLAPCGVVVATDANADTVGARVAFR